MMKLLSIPMALVRLLLQNIFLALGQIWANKTRSILTTIGIIIGVASVTAVIAALTGLKTNILDEFQTLGTNQIYIFSQWPNNKRNRNISWRVIQFQPRHFEGMLEHCPSINDYTVVQEFGGFSRYRDEIVEDLRINAISPSWHNIVNRAVISGRTFSLIDEQQARNVCIINTDLRDKLKLDRECVGQFIVMNNRSFQIVGLIEKKVQSAMFGGRNQKYELFIPFATGWKLNPSWPYVIATSKSPDVSEDAKAEIRFFLRKTRQLRPGDPDNFGIEVIEQILEQFNKVAAIISTVAAGIVGISLLVAGVGIMNIMLVSVSERTREIGLRKAVGATPFAIMLQFLIEAVTLCFFGGFLGLACGQLITMFLACLDLHLDKAYIPMYAVVLAFGFSAAVGIIFGLFPAIKAACLDPIEALRHE